MDRLLSLLSTTQASLKKVGKHLDSPVVAVVGCQSSGKSSVLENMINLDLIPKKAGLCTRVPLELTLINDPSATTAMGEFKHLNSTQNNAFKSGNEKANLHAMREEIWNRTNALTGPTEIKDIPIFLEVRSAHVSNLLLIDLPGITKISVSDQSTSIVDVIKNLVTRYIKPKNTIILAVSPANMDLANSDSLQIARSVDPEGSRTLGVITKVDLMDEGTDCIDVLENRSYPLTLGYIAVVNRSQADLTAGKSLVDAKGKETRFFSNSSTYGHLADKMGSKYLTNSVSDLLIEKVKEHVPVLKQDLMENAENLRKQIEEIGGGMGGLDPVEFQKRLNQICRNYVEGISGSLEGRSSNGNNNAISHADLLSSTTNRNNNNANTHDGSNDSNNSSSYMKKEAMEASLNQKKKLSTAYNSRIDGFLKIKKSLMWHSRYVLHNNGNMSYYKSKTNLANPRVLNMKEYDIDPDTVECDGGVFCLVSKEATIQFKASDSTEGRKWVGMLMKGRQYLEAAGNQVYKLNRVAKVSSSTKSSNSDSKYKSSSDKGKDKKDKYSRRGRNSAVKGGLKGMSESLLKGNDTSQSAGSVIRIMFLTDFVPQMENTDFLGNFTSINKAMENATGYTFLNDQLEGANIFNNSLYSIISGMQPAAIEYVNKVENIVNKLAESCVPGVLNNYFSLKQKVLGVSHDLLKECTKEVLEEIDYEFELSSRFINCNDSSYLNRVPKDKPVLMDYLDAYVESFKVHIVDIVWKFIMVLIIKRMKTELMDRLLREVIYQPHDKIKALCEQDPSVVRKHNSLKTALREIEQVIEELNMISI